jgi:hypothetical protein
MSTQPVTLRIHPPRPRVRPARYTAMRHRRKRLALLAGLRVHHQKLVLRYDAAVRRADVAEARREALERRIRALDRAIAALESFAP